MAFGPGVEIGIFAARPRRYDLERWWATSEGAKAVLGELLGLGMDEVLLLAGACCRRRPERARAEAARLTGSPRSRAPAVQRWSSFPSTENRHAHPSRPAHPARRRRARPPAPRRLRRAVGSLVDVQIVDRSRGETLSTWRHRGST